MHGFFYFSFSFVPLVLCKVPVSLFPAHLKWQAFPPDIHAFPTTCSSNLLRVHFTHSLNCWQSCRTISMRVLTPKCATLDWLIGWLQTVDTCPGNPIVQGVFSSHFVFQSPSSLSCSLFAWRLTWGWPVQTSRSSFLPLLKCQIFDFFQCLRASPNFYDISKSGS